MTTQTIPAPIPAQTIPTPTHAVEVYDDTRDALPIDAMDDAERRALADKYYRMGLDALGRRTSPRESATRGHLMSESEEIIWAWRYPTVYGSPSKSRADLWSARGAQIYRPWSKLEWPVPEPVLAQIKSCRVQFERLEIWTPELRQAPPTGLSPILVGVRQNHDGEIERWLLARWAEALEPFERIAAKRRGFKGWFSEQVRLAHVTRDPREDVPCAVGTFGMVLFGVATFVAICAEAPGVAVWTFGAALAFLGVRYSARNRWAKRWACRYVGWVDRT